MAFAFASAAALSRAWIGYVAIIPSNFTATAFLGGCFRCGLHGERIAHGSVRLPESVRRGQDISAAQPTTIRTMATIG
jgi:hypothetical protein